ncbi:MAG: HAD hydrolase family protein [Bacteroidota bacterium]
MKINTSLQNKFKNIRLLAVDVDGVLTDGGMYYTDNGVEFKRFSVRDGMGLHLIRQIEIKVAIVTLEDTAIVRNRADKLKIVDVFLGARDKVKSVELLLARHNLKWDNICFVGDDVNDSEVLKRVGLAITPNDGIDENKKIAHYITNKKGGDGCVREICDLLLKYQTKK